MDVNYFICTLGQAALPGTDRPFRDVNHLIDEQAAKYTDLPAVGLYLPSGQSGSYETKILTFGDLSQGVSATSELLSENVAAAQGQTIALLCNSSPAFLFSWLALIRLGHPVLLIAPQCSPLAIAHLSQACQATLLLYDGPHRQLATEAADRSGEVEFSELTAQELPFANDDEVFEKIKAASTLTVHKPHISGSDIAYLHHTSGTSTGIPKPIPQSHHGGVGVLPALDGSGAATFTTTPLYHGGVADSFRAWASNALIWLFPSQHAPVTASNIIKCLEASKAVATTNRTPSIRYFSSVPYVLQMMAQDRDGLRYLQDMDIVGVGGAALPLEVGNKLVRDNVNLVSRYGSAECGFLMSSHRDYQRDKGWHYLRRAEQVKELKFEMNQDGQSELVILPGWPHMAKTNREDGSFATSDLFEPHPGLPHTWRYHSRADSQLTLITGKKFDPSPLEGSLTASSGVLNEVLIFGNGRPYPGALLFRSEVSKGQSDTEIVEQLARSVEKLNAESQSHARIPRNMLIPMPYETTPLEKSSKGTILRGRAEEKYERQIEAAYNKTALDGNDVDDESVPDAITRIVDSVVGTNQERLTTETDLFAHGVDSVACVQIRRAIAQLLPKDAEPLALTVIEDSGNIARLGDLIIRLRKGESSQGPEDQGELLHKMVERYSVFDSNATPRAHPSSPPQPSGRTILMTGPTGSLGAHILSQLLADPGISHIHLLVRGATPHAAHARVTKALTSRRLPVPDTFDTKTTIYLCKFSDPHLGLPAAQYDLLTDHVDVILHLAWSVNFLVSLSSLAPTHLAGLQHLLNLASACASPPRSRPPHLIFCSSVASVSPFLSHSPHQLVPESIISPSSFPLPPTGYGQSKLAAELICARYASHTSTSHSAVSISIVRVGQLSGATHTGVWSASEAYPLMLASVRATGSLPDLKPPEETLGWVPVDVAAAAFGDLVVRDGGGNDDEHDDSVTADADSDGRGGRIRVLHLLNPNRDTTWGGDMLRVLRGAAAGETFDVVSPAEWVGRLEGLRAKGEGQHPALRLLGFWQKVYGTVGSGSEGEKEKEKGKENGGWEMAASLRAMPSLKAAVGPLDDAYLLRLWEWVRDNVN